MRDAGIEIGELEISSGCREAETRRPMNTDRRVHNSKH